MTTILEKYEQATNETNAWVIEYENVYMAKIIGTQKTKSLRCNVFIHIFGVPMLHASADGGGYNKVEYAIREAAKTYKVRLPYGDKDEELEGKLIDALIGVDNNFNFIRRVEDAGFKVLRVL